MLLSVGLDGHPTYEKAARSTLARAIQHTNGAVGAPAPG